MINITILILLITTLPSMALDPYGFPSSFSNKGIDTRLFNDRVAARKEGEKVIISGKNCEDLRPEVTALKGWSKKNGNVKCVCDKEDCEIDVTALVPDFVRKSQGICPIKPGPNCWNASLVSAGLTGVLRYSSEDEMNFWMTSPLCHERGPEEKVRPGDVIAIRSYYGQEVHGFINLSENISFSKDGYSNFNCYSLQSPQYVFKLYGVEKDCERVQVGKTPATCANYANVFKCESIDDYLKKHPFHNSEEREAFKGVNKLECDFLFLMKDENALKSFRQVQELTRVTLLSLKSLADSKLVSNSLSDDDKFIWKGIKIKSEALLRQMDEL